MRVTSMAEAAAMAIRSRARALLFLALLPGAVASQQVPRVDALHEEISKAGGRVIVGIKPSDAPRGMTAPGVRSLSTAQVQVIANRLSALGLRVTRNYRLITAVAGTISGDGIDALAKDPNVEYIVPDRIHTLQLDTGLASSAEVRLVETVPWGVSTVNAPSAWAATVPPNYGAGVKVGILDTGGDFDHEDLAYAGGFDAILNSTAPADWDDNLTSCGGHGTHVAGIVGAVRANNLGYVGVAPGASVYAIQVFIEYVDPFGVTQCGAFTSDIVAGVDWAAGNGMQVLNMSLGCLCFDPAEHAAYQAAAAAGVHLVAAAGNSNLPTSGFSPAAYPEVIAVAATDINDFKASFSNFGPEVFVAAPGVGIPSTTPGNTYTSFNGTSQASPHVAGLVALLLAADPSLSDASIRGLLAVGAIDLGAVGRDDFFGEGRVDALNSINRVSQQPTSAVQLALTQQPVSGTSGQPLVPAPEVELRDAQNQPVQQAGVIVTATISSGPGQITGLGTNNRTKAKLSGGPGQIQTVAGVTDALGRAVFPSLTVNTIVTGDHELTFSAGGLTPVVSSPFSVTGSVTTLTNAVPVGGLSGTTGSMQYFVISVPAGQAQLSVTTSGGSGDADLFVRQGIPPTLGSFDCLSFATGNSEVCTILNPAPGDWYILEFGYVAYSGMSLTATVAAAGVATQLTMTQQPGGAISGLPFTQQPIIQLADAQGFPVAQAGVLVTATIASGTGTISSLDPRAAGSSGIRPFRRHGDGSPKPDPSNTAPRIQATSVLTDANGTATFTDLTITGSGSFTIQFTATGLQPVTSAPFTVTSAPVTPLASAIPLTGLAGAVGSQAYYVISIPTGQALITVDIIGGTGDADLYLRYGALPTLATFDCRPFFTGNDEICQGTNPPAADLYIMIHGFAAYSGLQLTATYSGLPTQLAMLTQPGGAPSGALLVPQPVVYLVDAQGFPVYMAGFQVGSSIGSGSGTLSGVTTAATTFFGAAAFTDLAIAGGGQHTLQFSSSGLTGIQSAPFTVTTSSATQLLVTQQPGGAISGLPFTQQPIIQLADAQGLPVAQAGVPVTATVFSGPGVISGSSVGTLGQAPGKRGQVISQVSTAITDAAGTATFFSLTITGTGQHVLEFTAPALVAVQSQPFTVTAGRVATPLQKGVPVTVTGGLNSIGDFVLTVPTGAANLTVQTSGGTGDVDLFVQLGALPDTIANVDCASQSFTNDELCVIPLPAAGSWYITLFGFAPYAGVTLVADYTNSTATQLTMTQQPGGAVSGIPFAQQPIIQLADAQGLPVAQAGVPVTATVFSGPGVISGFSVATLGQAPSKGGQVITQVSTAITDAAGTATFFSLTITGAGQHVLEFTAPTMGAVQSQPFTVAAGRVATPLQKAVPVGNLAGSLNGIADFVLTVPPGATNLTVFTTGGTGDVDIFVKFGVLPLTTPTVDCSSQSFGNTEFCLIPAPAAGSWYITLFGFYPYSGVFLVADYTTPAVATQLTITQQPGGVILGLPGAISGIPFAQQPIIQLVDAQGLPVAQAGVPVTATVFSGPGVISGSSVGTLGQAPGKRGPVITQVSTVTTDAAGTATFTSLTITGTGPHVLEFTAPALVAVQSQPFTVLPGRVATPLQKGVPVTNLAGGLNSIADFVLTVPAGAANLTVQTSGGTGDVDLFVQHNVLPDTIENVDCASFSGTNTEVCVITAPAAGSWYVTLFGFAAYTGVTLVVVDQLAISTASPLPAGAVGSFYSQTFQATGGTAPYTWNLPIPGSLPAGLALNPLTGVVFGTPTASGTTNFGLRVSDAGGRNTQQSFSLTIAPALVITTQPALPPGTVAVPYNQMLAAAGGTGPYTWSVTSGSLPPGLTLTAATGALSGTPSSAGAYGFTAQANDTGAGTAQRAFTLAITGIPAVVVTSMVDALTGGPALSPAETALYNCNASAGIDVGDLLCYLDANPSVSLTAEQLAAISALMASDRPDAQTDDLKTRGD